MTDAFLDYFRCPEHLRVLEPAGGVSAGPGFFRFGDAVCYGRQAVAASSPRVNGSLADVSRFAAGDGVRFRLPFDLSEVVTNLRCERYPRQHRTPSRRVTESGLAHHVYYFFRPVLPVSVRRHLQRLRLSGWPRIAFPRWPVDLTVETLMRHAVGLLLKEGRVGEFPFIWFWPDGAPGCVMMTHDVEGPAGADRAGTLMDLDERFGIPSAFQLVPEAKTTGRLLERCRARGFEVNVHDLNHDGHLFRDRALFDRRAAEISRYAREFGCRGFRSGAMYRRQDWFPSLDVAFDMSVPNVAHLEPQQGGCCTVMPHFLGDVLELPLTTTQDYSLFHILDDHSTALWKAQTELILASHGLASFIVHPDYLAGARERDVYVELLEYLVQLRDERRVWVAPPSEIDRWWRQRREMRLVPDGTGWRIEGPGSGRARLAYARLRGDDATCELEAA